MLEMTGTVEKRKMREQVLDQMDIERERGITIKMTPARMNYHPEVPNNKHQNTNKSEIKNTKSETSDYILNLIDTPGHIDFSYEVSRALKAVEGAILLVDATQGVQAQTLSVLNMAREQGLVIIPVLNKTDLISANPEEVEAEVREVLDDPEIEVLRVSAKTGEGVDALLQKIVEQVPPPNSKQADGVGNNIDEPRALIFDFSYSSHRGVTLYVRMFDGAVKKGDKLRFASSGREFAANSLGIFKPEEVETDSLATGEIGYIVTGIKEPGVASVGDTILSKRGSLGAFEGFRKPSPVVWASLYPEDQDDFPELKLWLERISLSDSSLSFDEEQSGSLGRGFRAGFLGMLHMEVVTERLRREGGIELIIASPTITYEVEDRQGKQAKIYNASLFPDEGTYNSVLEPWVEINLITPNSYVGNLLQLFHDHEAVQMDMHDFGEGRVSLIIEMPLRELMRNFFDEVKSASSGFASLSYKQIDMRPADIVRLDLLVAEERVAAFSRVTSRRRVEAEGKELVERLHKVLPKQLFDVKIQAQALGRILSSKKLSAMRKDVTGHLYGGDVTRKKKLLEKQKKGKKRMGATGKVKIPHDVFLKMTKQDL